MSDPLGRGGNDARLTSIFLAWARRVSLRDSEWSLSLTLLFPSVVHHLQVSRLEKRGYVAPSLPSLGGSIYRSSDVTPTCPALSSQPAQFDGKGFSHFCLSYGVQLSERVCFLGPPSCGPNIAESFTHNSRVVGGRTNLSPSSCNVVLRLAHGPQLLRKPLSIHECHVWALTKAGHAENRLQPSALPVSGGGGGPLRAAREINLLAKSAISIAAQSHVVFAGKVIESTAP